MVHAKHIYITNNAAAHLYADTGLFRMFLFVILRSLKRSESTDNSQQKTP